MAKETEPQPKKHRHLRSYSVLVVSGDSDQPIRQFHLNHRRTQALLFVLFSIMLALLCFILYAAIYIRNAEVLKRDQSDRIAKLSAENESLTEENHTLIEQNGELAVEVSKSLEEKRLQEERSIQAHIPTGFPLSGSASMQSAKDNPNAISAAENNNEEGNPIVICEGATGARVLATGSGEVMTVTNDLIYGNAVSVNHGNGYISIYRSASTPLVRIGEEVDRGDTLFIIGGNNHKVGYQIQQNETYIDPEEMIEING